MSKISVFKFKIFDSSLAIQIINDYIESNEYVYSPNEQFFIGEILGNTERCLKWKIVDNVLIIKAFTRNTTTNIKAYIHKPINTIPFGTQFYKKLQDSLFSELQKNNMILIFTEVEKVKDDGSKNLIKMLLIIEIPIIIFFTIITLIVYFSTH